ncbi:MAG: bifunctional adenosylcobinamide kinase/adenosylcobinamide-phosphate guanylyltransferase [Zetaproteobacteria bacterium]|nr:bifunctional adenosylcobinamide kinase/adenosylcobinamide-phosphate guanylyltransferase [Zetaproteobacteria bacterium]
MSITLILGGARSGKSMRAESLVKQSGKHVVYLATAPHIKHDEAWQQRIEHHRSRRPDDWQCVEETLNIGDILTSYSNKHIILVDCMTLWLSNVIWKKRDVHEAVRSLCATLKVAQADVVMVSNELGMGLVPETALSRIFRDEQGRLNQHLAALSEQVEFVVAGLPMMVKGEKR